MRKLGTLSRILEIPVESASIFLCVFILVLVFIEVISRYVFAASHGFMEELSKWAQVWLVYLMMGVIEKRRRHIMVDIFVAKLSEKYKLLVLIIISVMNILFAIVLCWAGIEGAQFVKQTGLHSTTEIPTPMWIVRLCIPIGAIFLGFFSIEHLITDIRLLRKSGEKRK